MNTRKRLLFGIGGGVAVLAIGSLALINTLTASPTVEMVYETDGPSFADVLDLTRSSQAVADVRILSAGPTYLIPFDAPVPQVAPPRKDDSAKGKFSQSASTTPVQAVNVPNGILKTDFNVEVLDSVRGANIHKGQQLVVSQLGGKSADGKVSTVAEHDPLMQVGAEEILFLNQDRESGKFFTTGGGVGRFIVQSNGAVSAVDHDSSISRIHTGKPASFLKSAVQAVP